jgi:CTP synthase
LGSRVTVFDNESVIRSLYGGVKEVHERHRHRYEVNPSYVSQLEGKGLRFVGKDEKGERMGILELKGITD